MSAGVSSSAASVESLVSETSSITLDGSVSFKEASSATLLLEVITSALLSTSAATSVAQTRLAADTAVATTSCGVGGVRRAVSTTSGASAAGVVRDVFG
jgi:hypothetical protein